MKKLFALFLLLFAAVMLNAANMSFVLTNNFGQSDTNWILVTPVSTPQANGSYMQTGIPFRLYPGVAGVVTNLPKGNYNASNWFLASGFVAPLGNGSGTPLGVYFAVPDDSTTNIYSFCAPGILISGANTFNFTPGVRRLIGTNGIVTTPINGMGDVTIDGNAFSPTFGQVTNSLGFTPLTAAQVTNVAATLDNALSNNLGSAAWVSTNLFDTNGAATYQGTLDAANIFSASNVLAAAIKAATNGYPWGVLYDAAGAALNATNTTDIVRLAVLNSESNALVTLMAQSTNTIGIGSGLSAFVNTNRFDTNGAGLAAALSVSNILAGIDTATSNALVTLTQASTNGLRPALGFAAFQNTNFFDLAGAGLAAAHDATNTVSLVRQPDLNSASNTLALLITASTNTASIVRSNQVLLTTNVVTGITVTGGGGGSVILTTNSSGITAAFTITGGGGSGSSTNIVIYSGGGGLTVSSNAVSGVTYYTVTATGLTNAVPTNTGPSIVIGQMLWYATNYDAGNAAYNATNNLGNTALAAFHHTNEFDLAGAGTAAAVTAANAASNVLSSLAYTIGLNATNDIVATSNALAAYTLAVAGTAANAQNLVDNQGNVLVQPEYSYTTNLIPSLNTNQLWVTNTAVTGADGWTYWNSIMGCYTNSAWVIGYVASDGYYEMGVPPFSDLNFGTTYYDDNQLHMTNCSTIQNLIWVPDTGSSSTVLTYFPTNSMTTNVTQQTLGILVVGNVSGGAVGLTNFGLGVFTEANLDNTAWMYYQADRLGDNLNVRRYAWTNVINKLKAGQTIRIQRDGTGLTGDLTDPCIALLTNQILFAGQIDGGNLVWSGCGNAYTGAAGQAAGKDGFWYPPYDVTTNAGATVTPNCTTLYAWNVFAVSTCVYTNGSSFQLLTNDNAGGAYGVAASFSTEGWGTNGAVLYWTNSFGPQQLGWQLAATSAGTNRFFATGYWNTNVTGGFLLGAQTWGGSHIYDELNQPTNIIGPIYQAWNPDLILWQSIESVNIITNYLSQWVQFYHNWAPNAWVVLCGTYPSASTDQAQQGLDTRFVALTNGCSYFDGFSPFESTNVMNARGLFVNDGIHMPPAYPLYGYWLYRWLDFQDFYYQ